jgi:hypothetical protein
LLRQVRKKLPVGRIKVFIKPEFYLHGQYPPVGKISYGGNGFRHQGAQSGDADAFMLYQVFVQNIKHSFVFRYRKKRGFGLVGKMYLELTVDR